MILSNNNFSHKLIQKS